MASEPVHSNLVTGQGRPKDSSSLKEVGPSCGAAVRAKPKTRLCDRGRRLHLILEPRSGAEELSPGRVREPWVTHKNIREAAERRQSHSRKTFSSIFG